MIMFMEYSVECCTNMILIVHVSAYVMSYNVKILQLLHILHFSLMFCDFSKLFSILLPWQLIKFKSHFERAFNYLSYDITHVSDTGSKKSNTFFKLR